MKGSQKGPPVYSRYCQCGRILGASGRILDASVLAQCTRITANAFRPILLLVVFLLRFLRNFCLRPSPRPASSRFPVRSESVSSSMISTFFASPVHVVHSRRGTRITLKTAFGIMLLPYLKLRQSSSIIPNPMFSIMRAPRVGDTSLDC